MKAFKNIKSISLISQCRYGANAELGYQETQSSQLLADALKREGFIVKRICSRNPYSIYC
jgi:hypothetical protein